MACFHQVADVSEAVRQYADALMLSGESAIGLHGQKALSVLEMTSNRMESWGRVENQQSRLHQYQLGVSLPDRIAEQICKCAAEMGNFTATLSDSAILNSKTIEFVAVTSSCFLSLRSFHTSTHQLIGDEQLKKNCFIQFY